MNLIKWFAYLTLCGTFIWFVFFKPLHIKSAETITTDSEYSEDLPVDTSSVAFIDTTESYPLEEVSVDTPEEQANERIKQEIKTGISDGINVNAKYLVVVGSFSVKSNAEKLLAKLKKIGKDAVITNIKGLHRIVTASSDNAVDAQNLRHQYAQSVEEKAFVLEQ